MRSSRNWPPISSSPLEAMNSDATGCDHGEADPPSILHGTINLRTTDADILDSWRSILRSIPSLPIEVPLEPFQTEWNLARSMGDDSRWMLSGPDGAGTSFPVSSTEQTVAYLEHLACSAVLSHGGKSALPVHAAAVAPSPRGMFAIVGSGTSGKSSTSALLWESGWSLHGDDRCFLFERETSAPWIVPIPRRISLRLPALTLLKESTRDAILGDPHTGTAHSKEDPENSRINFRPSSVRPEPHDPSFDLKAIILLEPDASPTPERLDITSAIRPLLSCTAIHDHQTPVDTLTPWLSVLDQVPLFRVGRSSPQEMVGHFGQLAEQLELV